MNSRLLSPLVALGLIVIAAACSPASKKSAPEAVAKSPAESPEAVAKAPAESPESVAKAPAESFAARAVSFPTEDGGLIEADEYGAGDRGVLLAHGARFDKLSWAKQALTLAQNGFRVLAINFRGYGNSRAGSGSPPPGDAMSLDVLAAVRYLRASGAKSVSIVGASMGGGAAAQATIECKPEEIDSIVLIASAPIPHPELMKGRKLYVIGREDGNDGSRRFERVRGQFQKAPDPKELMILETDAHAQALFDTDLAPKLMSDIIRFLKGT